MKSIRILALCAIAATVAVAAEPLNIRPGHWSVTTSMTAGGAPLYIESMPAASRADYAQQWAKDVGKTTTDTDDECLTEKKIRDTDFFRDMRDEAKSCKQSISKQTSSAIAGTLECKDAKTSTKTELNYTADSPTSFKGSLKSTMTSPNGVTTMTFVMSGKWVAASCPAGEEDEEEDAGE